MNCNSWWWVGLVARMGATRNAYTLVIVGEPVGEWPFERLKIIWESRTWYYLVVVPDTSSLCMIAMFLLRHNCSSAESRCIHWWIGNFVAYLWWYSGQAYSIPWPLMASGLEILFPACFLTCCFHSGIWLWHLPAGSAGHIHADSWQSIFCSSWNWKNLCLPFR